MPALLRAAPRGGRNRLVDNCEIPRTRPAYLGARACTAPDFLARGSRCRIGWHRLSLTFTLVCREEGLLDERALTVGPSSSHRDSCSESMLRWSSVNIVERMAW